MQSSDSEDELDALFPSANDPPGGPNNGLIFTSELSPPASQDYSDQNGWNGLHDEKVDLEHSSNSPSNDKSKEHADSNEPIPGAYSFTHTHVTDENPTSEDTKREHEPGSAWNNTKTQEECQRIMEGVLDRKFNLRKIEKGLKSLKIGS